jgi:hypothetical protein
VGVDKKGWIKQAFTLIIAIFVALPKKGGRLIQL